MQEILLNRNLKTTLEVNFTKEFVLTFGILSSRGLMRELAP